MNFNSLLTKITFVFIVSIFLFISVFIFYYYYQENHLYKQLSDNYSKISRNFKENRLSSSEIISYLEKLNFEVIDKPGNNLTQKNVVAAGPGFGIIKYKDSFYLDIHTPDFRVIAKDLDSYSLNYFGFLILGFILIIFILSFLWIINSLKPLKKLKHQIQEFSNGNLNINCKSDKKDEIAQVANEFDNAVKKISLLLNSRQLFLRTVMHELKTPIAKGRIISELLNDDKQRNRMITIFDKLNLQINDFSKIEEIVSQNYSLNKYIVPLSSVVEKSIEMLMLDKPLDKILLDNISNKNLKIDLELFSLAIKNLLDNGIKYSNNKKVKIEESSDNYLLISSYGENLSKPLVEYFKAYHNDIKSKNHGMGLGLYIVQEIMKMHNTTLEYEHINGRNIFKMKLPLK